MAIYKITDLVNRLSEITSDGYDYVDLDEDIDGESACIFLEAMPDSEYDYEAVESVSIPEEYYDDNHRRIFNPNDICASLHFSFRELATMHHAVTNALEGLKEHIATTSPSKEELRELKLTKTEWLNLQAKLAHFLSRYKFR